MKQVIIAGVAAFIVSASVAQFSVIQDGTGETSLLLPYGKALAINAQQASIDWSVAPPRNNVDSTWWRFTGTVFARNGTASLFSGGDLDFNGSLGLNKTWDKSNGGNLKYWYLGAELTHTEINVFDSTRLYLDQIYEQVDLEFRFNAGFNRIPNSGFFDLIGVSASAGIKDNSDLLSYFEITTNAQLSSAGTSSRYVSSTKKVYMHSSLTDNLLYFRVNGDIAKYVMEGQLLALFHVTYAWDDGSYGVFNPALGVYAVEKDAPLEAKVGIQMQFSDLFNNRGSSDGLTQRGVIVLTGGFSFN